MSPTATGQDLLRPGQVGGVGHRRFDSLAADFVLQLVGRTFGDLRPWSITTISSASWSASSRYWVVRSSVVPPATSSRITAPQIDSTPWVETGGWLVEEEDRWLGDQGCGHVESPPHASRVGLDGSVGRVGQIELLE